MLQKLLCLLGHNWKYYEKRGRERRLCSRCGKRETKKEYLLDTRLKIVSTPQSNMKFLKEYIWAIKESYSFMEGLRGVRFWLSLPFVAGKIAYWNVKDMCGPDCKKKGHNQYK